GRPADAAHLFRRAAGIMRPLEGDADLTRIGVQALSHLAGVYRHQGRYRKAEPLYKEALGRAEKFFGPDHPEVAYVLNDLGVLYKYAGRFPEAGRHYRRALAITKRHLGLDSSMAATLYHNLGGLEHSRGRYAKGEPFARRSVAIRARQLGPDHPHVAADEA